MFVSGVPSRMTRSHSAARKQSSSDTVRRIFTPFRTLAVCIDLRKLRSATNEGAPKGASWLRYSMSPVDQHAVYGSLRVSQATNQRGQLGRRDDRARCLHNLAEHLECLIFLVAA